MIIEFIGLPGSGKTTVCRHLAGRRGLEPMVLVPCSSATFGEGATSHLPTVYRKLIAAWRVLCSFRQAPWVSLKFLLYGLSSRPVTAWKIEQTLSGLSMLPRLYAERESPRRGVEVLIFEQGLVQLFGSLALPCEDQRHADPKPATRAVIPGLVDGLVFLECPQEFALRRVRERLHGKSRFDAWGDAEALKYLPVMESILVQAAEAAESAGVPVLRVDADLPPADSSAVIVDWLLELRSRAESQSE